MHKRWTFGSAVLSCALATAGLQAQNQTGRTAGTQQDQRITVTGCLQAAAAGAGGQTQAQGNDTARTSDGDATGFVLVNASRGPAPGGGSAANSPTPPGSGSDESAARVGATPPSATAAAGASGSATGTSGTSSTAGNAMGASFVLRGHEEELTRHVGRQVEISGRLSAPASPGSGGAPRGSGGSTGTTGSNTNSGGSRVDAARNDRPTISTGQAIEVTTIRMLGTICAQP